MLWGSRRKWKVAMSQTSLPWTTSALPLATAIIFTKASVRLWSVHVPHYIGLVSTSLARHPANAVELATKVCFLLFDDSEVSATDIIYVGKIMQRVVPQKLAAHLPYRYTYRKSGNSCVHLINLCVFIRGVCSHELNHTGFTHYVITTYSTRASV